MQEEFVQIKRTQLALWVAQLDNKNDNRKIVAFEMNFELHKDVAHWLVPKVKGQSARYEVRDFEGNVTQHGGMIAAVKHIRDKHGWSLLLAKKWCDKYGRDTSTHDEYGRPYDESEDQPF